MMMFMRILAIVSAIVLHALVLLFGGIFFLHKDEDHGTLQVVDLLSDDEVKKEEKKEEPKPEEITEEQAEVPDASEIIKTLDISPMANEPELSDASLSSIEAALNGQLGSGEFGQSMDLESGGRIGATGKRGQGGDDFDKAFSMDEIDQRPQAIYQSSPVYPPEMRGKRVEGLVTLIFIVDASGKVTNPKVERSSNPAFEKPALDAIRKWKFEPAVKGGERVACKIRAPIRFPAS